MTALACLTLKLPPPDLQCGEFFCTRLDGGRLRIDHASPRVLISAELLTATFAHPAPGITLDTSLIREGPNGTPFWEGAILKISGVNQTVIYHIKQYVPSSHCYIGEWPH